MKLPGFAERFLDRIDAEIQRQVLETTDWKALSPEEKVRIIERMGFVAYREKHQPECPIVWDSGLICNCVPSTTVWCPPTDVQVARKETWEDRQREAREWKTRTRR